MVVDDRRGEALALAEELLGDIELDRCSPVAIARKAGRLARLLDDVEAMRWLSYEATGYPATDTLDEGSWNAAERSHRVTASDTGKPQASITPLGKLATDIEAALTQLGNESAGVSSSDYAVIVERNRMQNNANLRKGIGENRQLLDRVIGAIHAYVADRQQELRFGSAVETAFSVVRQEVDGAIAELVPDALPMISAAFENSSSENPEHWQNAAGTCRRLLMTAGDRLRPAGPDVNGRRMGPNNYVNRLVDWIVQRGTSETASAMIAADLEYLGKRLDAADGAGQKGAHVGEKQISRFEASRFVTGTYLVLGDILRVGAVPTSED
jgi:hypothetical protein